MCNPSLAEAHAEKLSDFFNSDNIWQILFGWRNPACKFLLIKCLLPLYLLYLRHEISCNIKHFHVHKSQTQMHSTRRFWIIFVCWADISACTNASCSALKSFLSYEFYFSQKVFQESFITCMRTKYKFCTFFLSFLLQTFSVLISHETSLFLRLFPLSLGKDIEMTLVVSSFKPKLQRSFSILKFVGSQTLARIQRNIFCLWMILFKC